MKTQRSFHKYLTVLLSISFLSCFYACDAFLEMEAPETELVSPVVFSSNSTANAAMLSMYARMVNITGVPSREIPIRTGLLSDEFINYSTNQQIIEFYTNSLSLTNSDVLNNFWTPYYNLIFQCNAIIEGLQNNPNISEQVNRQLTGEAKFLRAYYHFNLANLFGAVPIITSTDYRINASVKSSPQTAVYDAVVGDLLIAKELLNAEFVGGDGTTATPERVRPSKAAAQAFLARVYLYQRNFQNAEKEATAVIDDLRFALANLTEVFTKNSTEAVWQLQTFNNLETNEAGMFVLTTGPTSGLTKMTTIRESLVALFEEEDARKESWLGQISTDGTTHYFPNKYKNTGSNNLTEYSTILRLSELYLIRAESRIRQEKIEDGIEDLNRIRARANVDPLDWQTISNPLLQVENERQRELFAEGHRWFDLIRTQKIDEVMSIITPAKGGIWQSTGYLLPIPQIERDKNPDLTQNDGY